MKPEFDFFKPLVWPGVSCQCGVGDDRCFCSAEECALRAWAKGNITTPMTPEQRAYCLSEIDSTEGYSASDYEMATDAQLASGVLAAWVDYCRDKGLL